MYICCLERIRCAGFIQHWHSQRTRGASLRRGVETKIECDRIAQPETNLRYRLFIMMPSPARQRV